MRTIRVFLAALLLLALITPAVWGADEHAITRKMNISLGNRRGVLADVTWTTYATGGAVLTAAEFGMNKLEQVLIQSTGKGGYLYSYTPDTDGNGGALLAYLPRAAHTHTGGTIATGASAAGASHNHVFTGSELATHQHAAITAGTPSGTLVPKYEVIDLTGIAKPAIALTHNADPVGGLSAAALYLIEDQGQASLNIGRLESTTAANADVNGETANGSVYGAAASCRFFVNDSDTPGGVPIYVDESASDRLEFVSPTTTDCYIIMPFEAVAGVPAGAAVAVKVYHDATAATGKPLYFDDNGAADAQLAFVDTGAAGGTIPAADITILRPTAVADVAANLGTFTGAEMGTHQHAAITAGTPAGTNAAEATHTHAGGTLASPTSGSTAATVADQVGAGAFSQAVRVLAIGY